MKKNLMLKGLISTSILLGAAGSYAQITTENDIKPSTVQTESLTSDDLPTNPGPILFSAKKVLEDGLVRSRYEANKIVFFLNLIDRALKITKENPNENQEVVEFALRRAEDIVAKILPVIGTNTDLDRLMVAELLQGMIKLAIDYAKEPSEHPYKFWQNGDPDIQDGLLPDIHYGTFGVQVAQLFQTRSKQNLSQAAESILLIRGLGYLGQDVKSDLATRVSNQRIQNLLSEIVEIQQSPARARIVADINGTGPSHTKWNPNPSDVGWLRSRIMDVIKEAAAIFPAKN